MNYNIAAVSTLGIICSQMNFLTRTILVNGVEYKLSVALVMITS